ncbi:response regulator [Geitlerinema sp. PCC 7407]|uniref:response regulator n=1 Tax=Geitlerinema sp. PCC 7407 TaxID=1173025 RepID=UPI00029FC810|nr:response regulator [Geitlerinema sp. PCC 7407]AFY66478.1 response regulator receiver protein [Geitlerinema sp. PCC 7407]
MLSHHVLIVDDEANIREILQACLGDVAGWQVSAAASGPEGLTKAIAERPDAIVLDLMMPEMDGIAFLRRLRMHPETETIPVVILTAKTYLVELGQLDHLGVAGAIAKPFNPLELPTQIARALQWHAAIDA